MSLEQVPADIWLRIVRCGLSFQDLLCITSLSRTIHSQLIDDEYLWNFVCFDRWERVYADYEIPIPYTCKGYDKARLYYGDQCLFISQLELYDPNSEHNYDYFEERFSTDPKFIPILYNYCKENEICVDEFNPIGLTEISLATKLLVAAIRHLGIIYFHPLIEEMAGKNMVKAVRNLDVSPDYEQFWFRFSLFDDASHRLVEARRKKLSEISEILRKRIYVGMLLHEENGGILKYDTSNRTIYFEEQSSFEAFLYRVVRLILKKLTIKVHDGHSETYMGGYYLEDFSILRIYSNEVIGHTFLRNAIVMKVISQFFKGMSIFVKGVDEKIGPIKVSLSKNFLSVNSCSISILEKSSRSDNELRIFHTSTIESRLVSVHHFASNDDAARYVSPMSIFYLLQYVLYLNGPVRKSFFLSIVDKTKVTSWFPKSKTGFHEENYERIKDLFSGKLSTMRGLIPLEAAFGRSDPSSKLNSLFVWRVDLNKEEESTKTAPFELGMFVHNSRLDIDGIIIAKKRTDFGWYLEVLTKQGTRMVFKESSLTECREINRLKRFFSEASLDIVGLQYVKAFNGRTFEFYT
ncbi:hypothetical protein CLIB1423_12S03532 [[Candida] railenensis]|uniref:F-box domain-containing protein n=1 Tax=[Candida] railenensis TaxID=45579 RepID=A0A9P0VZP7_9ASCO|nr:hypothetical protein CLIB1423_12S03532 [[Candida] railenensis]